ncbi:putative mitochondrial protein [Andalucia godoyi]|uniref:Putative mitochondrial protein n=1 Tax=Andalucia godoyi TaxID=505711 RepID=A0A8K0F2U7_ANDGO|nr:putative mitochondrial protein [Andalucia godoyi]|eukprot:ANDGO_04230.mRNA.1 putative mitochondrial protein
MTRAFMFRRVISGLRRTSNSAGPGPKVEPGPVTSLFMNPILEILGASAAVLTVAYATYDPIVYRSSVVSYRYWGATPSLEDSRRLMKKYAHHQSVSVFHHPTKHHVAVLEPGPSPFAVFALGATSALLPMVICKSFRIGFPVAVAIAASAYGAKVYLESQQEINGSKME